MAKKTFSIIRNLFVKLDYIGLNVLDRIKVCFTESIQTQIAAAEALPDAISRAAMMMVQSFVKRT